MWSLHVLLIVFSIFPSASVLSLRLCGMWAYLCFFPSLLFCPLEFTPASPDPRIPRRFGTSPRQSSMLSLRLALHQAFIGVLVFPSSPSQKLVYGLKSLPPNSHHLQRTHRYLARYDGPPVYLLLYHTLVFFMEQCLYL